MARAIMTTDIVPKEAFGEVKLRRGTMRIAGMTKGSGMIQPRMATTLGFVMTDANIRLAELRRMVRRGSGAQLQPHLGGWRHVHQRHAGAAGQRRSGVRPDPKELAAVEEGVTEVMETLARKIARDGEGAKKLVTIDVAGAPSDDAAERIARAIANSPLVKTAIAGSDPNWGRISVAAGNAGVAFDPRKVDIEMQGVAVCRGGLAAPFSEDDAEEEAGRAGVRDPLRRFAARAKASARSGPAISPKATSASTPATGPEACAGAHFSRS